MPALKSAVAVESVVSRRILVTVRRDAMTASAKTVWAHEFPILQTIFGDGEVREVDGTVLDEGYKPKMSPDLLIYNKQQDPVGKPSVTSRLGWVFTGNAEAEYNRLSSAYGRRIDDNQPKEPNVEYVYGRFAKGDFSRIIGRPQFDDCPDDQLREMIISFGYSMPMELFDSDGGEKKAARQALAEFRALDHQALVALAKQVGVEIG